MTLSIHPRRKVSPLLLSQLEGWIKCLEMDVHEAYHRLRITDQNAADDSIIANFVSCVSFTSRAASAKMRLLIIRMKRIF